MEYFFKSRIEIGELAVLRASMQLGEWAFIVQSGAGQTAAFCGDFISSCCSGPPGTEHVRSWATNGS